MNTPSLPERPEPLTPTIFHEDWWLTLASDGRYEATEVIDGGQVVGRFPYCLCRKWGKDFAYMPQLTHFLGPAINEGDGKADGRFLRRFDITNRLIAKLPPLNSVRIKCHRGVTDVIPFQANDFRSFVQFTHELYPTDEDTTWANLRAQRRNIIRSAEKRHEVITSTDAEAFMRFYDENLQKTGKSGYTDTRICTHLIEAAIAKGRGAIHTATEHGAPAAAIFCVWDKVSSYFLMATRSPASHSGAISLLTFRAMRDASQRGLIFDFDGLSNTGSIAFFAGFGATIVPRYILSREDMTLRFMRLVQSCRRGEDYLSLFS